MKRNDTLYLTDILESIKFIDRHAKDLSENDFLSDEVLYHAVIRHLEIIGEAVRALSPAIRRHAPSIPWRQIGDFRNVLVHEYFGVRLDIIWEVIQQDLPALKKAVEQILKENQTEE